MSAPANTCPLQVDCLPSLWRALQKVWSLKASSVVPVTNQPFSEWGCNEHKLWWVKESTIYVWKLWLSLSCGLCDHSCGGSISICNIHTTEASLIMDLNSMKNELNSILSCIDMSIDDNSIRSDLVLKTFHIFLLHSITLSYIFFR